MATYKVKALGWKD